MFFNAAAGWATEQYDYTPVFIAVGVTQIISAMAIKWFVPRIRIIEN